jgi:hypothetical protein
MSESYKDENILEPDSQIENDEAQNDDNHQEENNEEVELEQENQEEVELSDKNSKVFNEYHNLYCWLDTFKFSKTKKNMTRDFSDGVLFVELLNQALPKIVIEYHNVTPTLNKNQKKDNWYQIQKRINSRTTLKITNTEINDIINYQPYAIERIIDRLYRIILTKSKFIQPESAKIDVNNKRHYIKSINSKVSPAFKENCTFKSETKENLDCKFNSKEEIFKSIIEEKDNKLYELQSTLEFLLNKIKNLEEDNFKVEEMIIRYKNKAGKAADFNNSNQFNDSNII